MPAVILPLNPVSRSCLCRIGQGLNCRTPSAVSGWNYSTNGTVSLSYLQPASMACLAADNLLSKVILVSCPCCNRCNKMSRGVYSTKGTTHLPCSYIITWGGIRQKRLASGKALPLARQFYRSWIKTTWAIHCLYCGCSSNGLGKASSTTSNEEDQDFPAVVPPRLMISS